jgi:ComF family protein
MFPFNKTVTYLQNFLQLLYPKMCLGCGNHLSNSENVLCFICENELPKTHFHEQPENPVFKKMYGRLPVENATALFYFDKGNRVQHLMHQLKYGGKTEIGNQLGKMLGNDLKKSDAFRSVEIVIPVPLHEKRLRKRGYNQSDFFGQGIAEAMKINMLPKVVERMEYTETQTGKNRFERWDNVKEAFRLKNADDIKGKHVLLVDDVITTGATLEACGQLLMDVPDVRVSIATIAFAH